MREEVNTTDVRAGKFITSRDLRDLDLKGRDLKGISFSMASLDGVT